MSKSQMKIVVLAFRNGETQSVFAVVLFRSFLPPRSFSTFFGPTPSNAPRNDVAPLKTITYRAIKTTGTLIVMTVCKG